jgi:hypothetical protein
MNNSDSPRLFLPIVLAIAVVQGSLMPWVTIREFNGERNEFNLLDVRGGTSIVATISIFVIIGCFVAIFKRVTGITIISLAVSSLGWMAAISGALLGIVGSLLPSVNIAGLDLTRSSVGQGSGVTVTIISSFALAFIIVRQLPPIEKYSTRSRTSILPLVALVPLALIAINMHSEWMLLGSEDSKYQAIVAGDSLYGSGLIVLVLWMNIGLWIANLIIQRPIAAKFAGVVSILVSLVVMMYAVFLWIGGKALAWLIPANVEKWVTVSTKPMLYLVIFLAISLLVIGSLTFNTAVQGKSLGLSSHKKIGATTLHNSDLVAGFILTIIIVSNVYGKLT